MKVQLKFKNKVYENYLIDENGIIYDLNGNIQKFSIHQSRPEFKKVAIHRYVMHSFIGYKEKMDIHHLNEDKFDNRLDNLIYLTRSQHIKIHSNNRHNEYFQKMRDANLGRKNPMYGKTPANKGQIWVNNGIVNKIVKPNEIPEGFVRGMLRKV